MIFSRGRTPQIAVLFAILSVSLLLACFAFVANRPASAVPTTMNFQGRLADSSGNVVPNGLYNMQFRLFTVSSGGSSVWSETRETTDRVQVTNGLFSTKLGEVNPISASLFASGNLFFEITLATPATATCNTASCASWESPMSPRHQMSTSAYAFNSDTLDGLDSTAFAAASGSANYIQNTTSPQTANFSITGIGAVGTAIITPALRPSADSITAFQIQNAAGASTVMNIDTSNSRVGIGTETPSTALDVFGDITLSSGIADSTSRKIIARFNGAIGGTEPGAYFVTNVTNAATTLQVRPSGSGIGSSILLSRTSNGVGDSIRIGVGSSTAYITSSDYVSSSDSLPLVFITREANLAEQERMRITASGNVGIGTQTVNAQLHVAATASGNVGNIIQAASGQTADLLQIRNSSGGSMSRFNANGDLSVGGTNSANSDNAFAIQNASGTSIFTADTNDNNLTLGAATSLTLTGGNTASRPASPTEGMVYYDSETNQLLTYTGSKWQADSKTATFIVAASNSSQAAKDGAQYLADGEDSSGSGIGTLDGDQVQINQALTAASALGGGTVYLHEGTYTVDGQINIPNNVSLVGSGSATLIQFGNFGATSTNLNMIRNSDGSTGTNISIRNLRIDGRSSINLSGNQSGIYLQGIGAGSLSGATVSNVVVSNLRNNGVFLGSSTSNTIVSDNTFQSNGVAVGVATATDNTISNNKFISDTYGAYVNTNAYRNSFVDNSFKDVPNAIALAGSSDYTNISGNIIKTPTTYGINIGTSNNTVTNNVIEDSGGANANNAIMVSGDNNSILGNYITDTSGSTTNRAIDISSAGADNNYLSNNRFSSTPGNAVIRDLGTGTVYANQPLAENGGSITNRSANSTTSFQIQNATGVAQLTADTTNSRIQIGSSTTDATAILFVLDSYNQATDPTGVNGAMYYNTNSNKFRCNQNGTWTDCIGTGSGGVNTNLDNLTATSINQSLIAGSNNTLDIGSSANTWRTGYFGTSLNTPAIRPLADSSTALQIQNAAGSTTILTVDSSANTVVIGSTSNGVTIGSNGITLAGTARADATVSLSPEYAGATFTGDGTNNTGSLSSDFCSGSSRQNINPSVCAATQTQNYYQWTTTESTVQDYDIYVRYQMPRDYSTGSMANMQIWGWGTTSAAEIVTVALISDASATPCSTSGNAIASNATWAQATVASPLGACTPAAGDWVTFKVRVAADENNFARAGAITFDYKRTR